MTRRRFDWRLKPETIALGDRTILIGAINVAPDSPTDSGRYADPDRAFIRAMEMMDQGADLIEIGAETWYPGSERVSEAEELRRLVPVLKRMKGKVLAPICVETANPAVAEKAIEHGACVLRDPTALVLNSGLAKLAAQYDAGLVLQHMRGTPDTWAKLGGMKGAVGTVLLELQAAVSRATRAGVEQRRILLDPGLGMGKRKEQNSELIAGLDRFAGLECPIAISPSGQSFATLLPQEPGLPASVAACTVAIYLGVHVVRVHDVSAHRTAALVADGFLAAHAASRPAPAKPTGPARQGGAHVIDEPPRRPVRPPRADRPR
jgi:dihydropteroate synthase